MTETYEALSPKLMQELIMPMIKANANIVQGTSDEIQAHLTAFVQEERGNGFEDVLVVETTEARARVMLKKLKDHIEATPGLEIVEWSAGWIMYLLHTAGGCDTGKISVLSRHDERLLGISASKLCLAYDLFGSGLHLGEELDIEALRAQVTQEN
jgi:hypothetical protein